MTSLINSSDGNIEPGSFRDPSGFIFFKNGVLYRQINNSYRPNYDQLISSGLYQDLVDARMLVKHREVDKSIALTDKAYKVVEPELIDFISYPYEWCFSQLKQAALLTLEIQKRAFGFGMTLKDASSFNIQFVNCKPVFIDTLSFDKYEQGSAWVAYKQFCQHFLAPLALMSQCDIRLNQLSRVFIDGVPLDMASSLLPFRSWFKFSTLTHIHMHAKSQNRYAGKSVEIKEKQISKFGYLGILDSLENAIGKLKWQPQGTEWGDYYEETNYSDESMNDKLKIVSDFIQAVSPKTTWDTGANTGVFSRLASEAGSKTVSFDIDPAAVEKNYLKAKRHQEKDLLPLVLDLTNPTSSIGWANEERMSLLQRGPCDLAMALALIHHLAISNNVPLDHVAKFFQKISKSLIIEFVPKEDSQVQRLLATREDIFPDYNQQSFEAIFKRYFNIKRAVKAGDSCRTLYLMESK
jgi:hypothetical protein